MTEGRKRRRYVVALTAGERDMLISAVSHLDHSIEFGEVEETARRRRLLNSACAKVVNAKPQRTETHT